MKFDKTDEKIVNILRTDGMITNLEMSKRIGISEGAVRYRIKKLLENDYLKIKGAINPLKFKDKQLFYTGINFSTRKP